jgi:hypothetical protein
MLRYEYDFMPKGVITQLIVRLHRWIEQQQHVWRSGVVLNNGRARAEVIENYRPYNGEIRLCVSGLHSKELFSIVANEIDQINATYGLDDGSKQFKPQNNKAKRLKVVKKIPCNCEECQESKEPHYFSLQTLDRFLSRGRTEVVCEKSALDVPIRSLTAVIPTGELFAEQRDEGKQVTLFPDLEKQATQVRFERLKQRHTEYYPANQFYDVFLAYNSKDKPFVRQVYQQLKDQDLQPWIDEEEVAPGTSFQDEIQRIIRQIKTAAICIGPQGLGPWQVFEQRAFITRCVESKIPVIPVLLPGVAEIPEELVFLKQLNAVSFETEDDTAALDRLRWGITGEKP